MIHYTLVRSSRKTVGIYIMPDARVEVRAPRRCPVSYIEEFVSQKQSWIERKLSEAVSRAAGRRESTLREGGTLPLRGCELPVTGSESGSPTFDGRLFHIPARMLEGGAADAESRAAIIEIYRRLALPMIQPRVEHYGGMLGVRPDSVKVSKAAKRWGSCSGRGSVNFSWMLAAAHPDALDYVVVHELCHLRHHNHSARFWELVASVLPDYRQRQLVLRETEKRLDAIFHD